MKNLFKGYLTSLVGLVMLVLGILNFYGIYTPKTDLEWYEHLGALLISGILLSAPKTTVENALNNLFKSAYSGTRNWLQNWGSKNSSNEQDSENVL